MRKKPSSPAEEQTTAAALMALISKEVQKSEKQKNAGALRDWLELGCSVLEKFGDSAVCETAEFRHVLEKVTEDIAGDFPLSFPPQEPLPYEEKFTPEAAASMMNSCILFCDVVITGKDCAAGLKYNEENMFAPMIVLLEKGASAGALVWAAENLGVPVIKNLMLAKNLASYGKSGEPIPEVTYRDVSLVLARQQGSERMRLRSRDFGRSRRSLPMKIDRPLSVEMGESLFALTGEEPGREELLARPLNATRKKLRRLLGIAVPAFRILKNPRLRKDEYRILFRGLEAGRGRLELGWYASDSPAASDSGKWPGAAIPEMMKLPGNIKAAAKAAASVLVRHADEIIQRRAPELLGRDEVEAILSAAEEKYPVVTGEVKSLLSLGIIREILQSLVSEQVSIRPIAIILETLADWGSFGTAPSDLIIEQIRQSLKRQICLDYADDRMTLRVLTLEPKLEKGFADHTSGSGTETGNAGPWDPWSDDWADLIASAARGMEEKGYPPIVLCSPKARFTVKEATRKKFPELAVLSYLEIPSDIRVEPLGEIRFGESIRFS